MRSIPSYWFTDFCVKLLTIDSIVFKRLINSNIDRGGIESVLDVGCGTGTQAPLFDKSKYLGFDVDSNAVNYAKRQHPGYEFLVRDATGFKLKKKFDLVLIVGVLHHLNDQELVSTLDSVKHHLKQSGKLLIIEAIPPLFKWNFIGKMLRNKDRGSHIRKLGEYENFVNKKFNVKLRKNVYGGFFDYAFIVASF